MEATWTSVEPYRLYSCTLGAAVVMAATDAGRTASPAMVTCSRLVSRPFPSHASSSACKLSKEAG